MKTLATAILSILCLSIFAQKEVQPELYSSQPKGHGFGLIYTSSNGKGLAYRYLPGKNGFHAAFIPVSQTDQKYYSLNVTGYHEFYKAKETKLFLQSGIEWNYSDRKEFIGGLPPTTNATSQYNSIDNSLNISGGLGLEFGTGMLRLDLFLGYGAYIKTTNLDEMLHEYSPRKDETLINLSGGMAIFVVI